MATITGNTQLAKKTKLRLPGEQPAQVDAHAGDAVIAPRVASFSDVNGLWMRWALSVLVKIRGISKVENFGSSSFRVEFVTKQTRGSGQEVATALVG